MFWWNVGMITCWCLTLVLPLTTRAKDALDSTFGSSRFPSRNGCVVSRWSMNWFIWQEDLRSPGVRTKREIEKMPFRRSRRATVFSSNMALTRRLQSWHTGQNKDNKKGIRREIKIIRRRLSTPCQVPNNTKNKQLMPCFLRCPSWWSQEMRKKVKRESRDSTKNVWI